MRSVIEQIKQKLSIVDVVSQYVTLEAAGGSFKGKCPFHNEKTPSFFVSPARGTYHCFGCAKGGDIFSFIEEIEGVDFSQALKQLAARAGVVLEHDSKKEISSHVIYFDILRDASVFYQTELKKYPAVVDYLHARGLTDESIKEWGIGFAPDGWTILTDHLRKERYSDEDLKRSGLIGESSKSARLYDRFRSRIMFPIYDQSGKVVAFSGRIWGEVQGDMPPAKYINSPETEFYKKSDILYGYHKAKFAFAKAGSCVLVEGQMDLVLAHQAGTHNAVAVSGTALTDNHLRLIKRFTNKLVIVLDGDAAGIKAAERSALLAGDMDVRLVLLPKGLDPADLILKDVDAWCTLLTDPVHIVDFLFSHTSELAKDREERIRLTEGRVYPYIASITSRSLREFFIEKIANALAIPDKSVRTDIERIGAGMYPTNDSQTTAGPPTERVSRLARTQNALVRLILHLEEKEKGKGETVLSHVESLTDSTIRLFFQGITEEQRNVLLLEADLVYALQEDFTLEIENLSKEYERSFLESALQEMMRLVRVAETEGRKEDVLSLINQCQAITNKLHQ